jgi:hypothetical protein
MTNTGINNSGNRNSGDRNSGYGNSGNWNSGYGNSGDRNSGNWNTGNWNSGYGNSGNWNSGYGNSGYGNSGDRNSGNRNTGNWNSGDWNSGDFHVGCFNTVDAQKAYYFNTLIDRQDWLDAEKPDWIHKPSETTFINEDDMTDAEKVASPDFHVCGGYLRKNDMRKEWQKAYDDATPEDIELTKALPGFDAEVFLKITGIDLREDRRATSNPPEIVIDGATYVLKGAS